MKRGDVVLVDFPYTSGLRSKVRPAIVVQNDRDNQRLSKTIVAMITGNLRRAGEPTHLVIDPTTPEHAAAGLHAKSLVLHIGPRRPSAWPASRRRKSWSQEHISTWVRNISVRTLPARRDSEECRLTIVRCARSGTESVPYRASPGTAFPRGH
ncbi:MAG: hypothetical protein B7Z73_03980 [Planctomycetia bacterium 21-64-5]|nr:MAG: hypothetical protein B7Z73_03980 [Planctomycetia bacterium 21-64-5]